MDVFIHMPAALTISIGSSFYDWKYQTEPEPFWGAVCPGPGRCWEALEHQRDDLHPRQSHGLREVGR